MICLKGYPPGNKHIPYHVMFEDDFLFPRWDGVSSLEVKSPCNDCSMLDNRAGPFLAFADFLGYGLYAAAGAFSDSHLQYLALLSETGSL